MKHAVLYVVAIQETALGLVGHRMRSTKTVIASLLPGYGRAYANQMKAAWSKETARGYSKGAALPQNGVKLVLICQHVGNAKH